MRALMLVSREKNRFKEIDGVKVARGQFQTRGRSWLAPQVAEFLRSKNPTVLYDPFAGEGSLLRAAREAVPCAVAGLDIDAACGWPVNDSLRSVPAMDGAVIVTNPPFLARHSARRKGVHEAVGRHYAERPDLYQIALDRCRQACAAVVAIVPETILNSSYPMEGIASVTILEESPFSDTDCPVCVVCIDRSAGDGEAGPEVFLGSKRLGRLADLRRERPRPRKSVPMGFNLRNGRIALRAVDLPDPAKPVRFLRRSELAYPEERIKVSSRLVTFIDIPSVPDSRIASVVRRANRILENFRAGAGGILLSPFKGNTADGRRRRRLDYATARAILERAVFPT